MTNEIFTKKMLLPFQCSFIANGFDYLRITIDTL